jgi:prolyl oligopeptidase
MFRSVLLAGAAIAMPAAPLLAQELTVSDYPETERGGVVETQFGEAIADPYRWLENDVRNDSRVADWVAAQNRVADAYLDALTQSAWFKEKMAELLNFERFGIPVKRGDRYFFTYNTGLMNQDQLRLREGGDGEARILIDPNEWSEDDATALADWTVSEDGTKLLYSVQDGGSDWRTVRVMDVATGEHLSDEVEWVKFSALSFAKDGSGFYYSRFPVTGEGEAFQALNTDQAVYFHRLGTTQDEDELVFATPAEPELNHVATVSDDGRWLIVSSSSGTDDRSRITLIDRATPGTEPFALVPDFEHAYAYVGNVGSRFFFATNADALRYRVVSTDVTDPASGWSEVIGQRDETLEGVSLVGNRLIASYLADASSKVIVHDLEGEPVGDVALPGIGTSGGFSGKPEDDETFYAFTSFNRPATIYRYDVESGESEVWAAPELTFDPDRYAVEQRFYESRDGTRVPMFIVRRADLTGPAATLLYGYGGFNISVTPAFSASRMAWMEAGGTFVLANIRGGGEYGKEWHDAGRLANKQNVFDDFIAAGEYLKANGFTSDDGLAIEGRSNGGLLVGAVVNQRPELFDAGHAAVGVMDMLRFDRFTAGRYWVDDYGYPSREEDWRTLRSYSPYHNIRDGIDYPALLVTTADTDDRVVPGHSFKYTAALQAAELGDEPRIIRIETRAGHGSGKPIDKVIDEYGEVLGFLAYNTGLEVPRQ